jgi:hypothetical protein
MSTINYQLFKKLISLTAIFIIFFLISCSWIENIKEERIVKKIVSEYNRLLIEVNKTRNLEPMQKIADKPVVRKLYLWMAAWEDGNAFMDAELKSLDFQNIKITGNNASVKTIEKWDYEYRDLDTKEVLSPKESVRYEMEYILEKREGKWLITRINILKEIKRD